MCVLSRRLRVHTDLWTNRRLEMQCLRTNQRKTASLVFRPASCKYAVLGCIWEGAKANQQEHENVCDFPTKTGAELMTSVVEHVDRLKGESLQQTLLIQMLSCEKISICGEFCLHVLPSTQRYVKENWEATYFKVTISPGSYMHYKLQRNCKSTLS